MAKPSVINTSAVNKRKSNQVLASARKLKPVRCVVWVQDEDKFIHVLMSEGFNRTEAIGALASCAIDAWVRE